jgi:phosphoglycolate phosphatase
VQLRAALFDLDGVLIDSRVAIVRSIQHALAVSGLTAPPADELERFIGPPLIKSFSDLAGREHAPGLLARYRERYVDAALEETTAIAGAAAALAAVAARVPVAVATSKPRTYALPLCERLGLAAHLQAVIGPELDAPDESKTITVRRALTALGEQPGPDLPLVGDRSHDVVAAHANGLPCVGVLWGVGDEGELRRAGADPIVAAPADLPAALGL